MFTNELILQLKKLVDEKGDLEVYIEDEDAGFWPVDNVLIVHLLNLEEIEGNSYSPDIPKYSIRDVIGICIKGEEW